MLRVDHAVLSHALESVSQTVPSRPTHPILSYAILKVVEGGHTANLTTCDLTAQTSVNFQIEGSLEHILAIPFQTLRDNIKGLTGELKLTVITGDDNAPITLEVRCGTKKRKIGLGGDVLEFPNFSLEDENETTISLSGDDTDKLKNILRNVTPFASSDDTKQILTTIHFAEDGVFATDGHSAIKCPNPFQGLNTKLSANVVKMVLKLDSKSGLIMKLRENSILIECDDLTYQSRLLNGNYPQVGSLYPTSFKGVLTFDDPSDLKSSVSSLVSLADQKNTLLKLDCNKVITLKFQNDVNEGDDILECETEFDEPIELGLNGNYFKRAISSAQGETKFSFNVGNSPVVVSSESVFVTLVMPVQIVR